ncbi:MAG: alpha/beta hydrolase [Gemmatirosa sp.]
MLALMVRMLLGMPAPLRRLVCGEDAHVVDGRTLDPQLQVLRTLQRWRGARGLAEPTYLRGRRRFHREMVALNGPSTPVHAVRDFSIDGPGGALPVRHYAPAPSAAPRPLLVYLHGGGFVIGDLATHDEACRLLCLHAETHVLAVDYRLAPEHPFPAALDDTRAALRWATANAATLGADPSRVAIGGDSAGANLATVAARLAVRAARDVPCAQLVIYPATDSETVRPSRTLFGDGYFLAIRDRDAFTECYLGGTGVDGRDPCVSPRYASDLHGLPPALVVTAGFDMLRDEGDAYADALRDAGTPVRTVHVPSLGHGFVNMTGFVAGTHRAMVDVARTWRALVDAPVRATAAR